jgi:YidC/Oxa1 family membrane protein insertase
MNQTGPKERSKKELPNEVRMVIAFVVMGLILVATPYLYRKFGLIPPEAPKKAAAAKTAAPNTDAAQSAPPPAPAQSQPNHPADASAASNPVTAASEQTFTIDTSLYHVVFSNRGAVVRNWTLKNYKDLDRKPLELVNSHGVQKAGYPFSFDFHGQKPSTDLNTALWVAHPAPDNRSIQFEFADGRTTARKTFEFQPDSYMVQYADDLSLNGTGLPHVIQWRGGFGDMAVQGAPGHQETVRYDDSRRKLVTENAKAAKNGPVSSTGNDAFAGIEDQYFLAAFLPPPNTPLVTLTYSDSVTTSANSKEEPYPGVGVGGEARNQLGLYVGPKELNALKKVNPRLQDVIDWGWFALLAKPLFIALQWMNSNFVHNYGWSIVLLTIIITMALLPLKVANLKSMRKMQALQPEMNRINEKYKGVGMSNPKSQEKQQEVMELYKKNGVNPMGGCIPMLVQLPFLYAFWRVLAVTIELRQAPWLWVADLSQPEHFDIHFLPLIMIISGFLLQKMTPMAGTTDPNQQRIMQFMPLIWGFFFWSLASGLVLYYLTSNLVSMAQQWFFNKTAPPLPATVPASKPTPKGRKTA